MRPTPVGDLQFAQATHRSPYGLIASKWKKDGETFRWNVTVPPNTAATLCVPARNLASLTEGGKPVTLERGLKFLRMEDGCVVLRAGSGRYSFLSR